MTVVKTLSRLAAGMAGLGLALFAASYSSWFRHEIDKPDADGRVTLANGWKLTPIGIHTKLPGDMPANIVPLAGELALVNTCGYHDHSLSVVNYSNGRLVDTVDLKSAWIGLAFDSATGDVYVSGGSPEKFKGSARPGAILHYTLQGSKLVQAKPLDLPAQQADAFVSGIRELHDGRLAVLDIANDSLTFLSREDIAGKQVRVGSKPYGLDESADHTTIAVSNWAAKSVSLVDISTGAVTSTIAVGIHPTAVVYAPDGRLFVANASSNSVSVIQSGAVQESLRTSLAPGDKVGSAPVAIAVSPDSKRLYVANADNNDVEIFDISHPGRSRALGFVPTGRYPTALALSRDGKIFSLRPPRDWLQARTSM